MPRKQEDWITSAAAAKIMTRNSGHEVTDAYVRRLGLLGKIATKEIDRRTKLYLRSSVEGYRVRQRGKREETGEPVKEEEAVA